MENVEMKNHAEAEYIVYLAPVFLLISVPIRILITKYNWSITQDAFLFIINALIGIFIIFQLDFHIYQIVASVPAYYFLSIFLPIFIFNGVYNTDHHVFVQSLGSVLLISTFGVAAFVYSMALLLKNTIHLDWSFSMCIAAAIALAPISTSAACAKLEQLDKYKYLASVLKTELIMSFAIILIGFHIYLGYESGVVNKWYHFVTISIRYLSISVLIGCITVAMTFFTYFFVQYLFASSGPIAVICMTYYVADEKHKLSVEVDTTISDFWNFFAYISTIICFMTTSLPILCHSIFFFKLKNLYAAIILYFSATTVRLFLFILMGPIFNCYSTYNFNLKCMITMSWGGIKGFPNFILTIILLAEKITSKMARDFVTEFCLFSFLTLLINTWSMTFILDLIGLTDLSSIRRTNMNNCMKFVKEKRQCILGTLKINRYFSGANWTLSREETVLKDPYKETSVTDSESEEEAESLFRVNSLVCPDCYREVPFDMSEKDYGRLIREGRIIILKAKRVSIIKQYQKGLIDKICLQVLIHNLDIMIDLVERNKEIKPMDLGEIFRGDRSLERYRNLIMRYIFEQDCPDPPPSTFPFRRLCYFIVNHVAYNLIVYVVIVLIALVTFIYGTTRDVRDQIEYCSRPFFLIEVCIKIMSFSNISISNGIGKYLKSPLNIFDFTLVLVQIANGVLKIILRLFKLGYTTHISHIVHLVRLYRIFPLLQPYFQKFVHYINVKLDAKICFGYDLAIAMVTCYEDIFDDLKHSIDVKVIRLAFIKELIDEKRALIQLMEKVQKEKPWIAITVKTKQAIRSTLRSMEEALNEMKIQGYVDDKEYLMIFKEILDRRKFLRNLEFVQPSPPKIIFKEVSWMANDEKVIKYLYSNVEKITIDTGESVCKGGKFSKGVYILLTGILRLTYTPDDKVLKKLHNFGKLPIVDYLSTFDFGVKIKDDIMSGNSIGELSVLTGRPSNCSIVADSFCQALLLKTEVIKNAMRLNSHPITGLEARMWKCTTINLAVAVLIELSAYQGYTQEQIKFKLERSFMPNLSCYKMFVISELMEVVILIEGVASDYNTGEVFIAPIAIPRAVQKLILPRSSYLTLDENVETKLLIVPTGETQAYDIMEAEEEIAELVTLPSSKCLLHTVQDAHWRKRVPVRRNLVEGILTVASTTTTDNRTSAEKFEVLEAGTEKSSSSLDKHELLLRPTTRLLRNISEESNEEEEETSYNNI